jgi:hypothetical protein
MPKKDGTFTPEELAHISNTVNAKWAGRSDACPICGNTHWIIGDRFVTTTNIASNGGIMLGGSVFPMIALISSGCGYTRLMNAIILGLFPNPLGRPVEEDAPAVPSPPPPALKG